MRASKILGALILLVLFSATTVASKEALRPKFESTISTMEAKLKAEKNPKKKWSIFQKGRKDLIQLRKEYSRQPEDDELAFSDFLESFVDIPEKYDSKVCAEALKQSKTMMASRASSGNDSVMVKKSWTIIELLCKK